MIERRTTGRGSYALAAFAGALILVAAATQVRAQDLVGDTDRGEAAFTTEFKCYACHGYDAQTGERRLVPMSYTQQGFIRFVQSSPLPQMPAYPDVPAQALADIYAYIRTIPLDAPDVEDVPLLKELRDAKLDEFEQ